MRTVGFSEAFATSHGQWRGRAVTIVHPVDQQAAPSKAAQAELVAFVRTLALLQGHVGTQLIRGYCVEKALLVQDALLPWTLVSTSKLAWCVRLHAAATAARLFEFLEGDWHRHPVGAVVLCDFDGHDLAFTRNYDARLVNLVGCVTTDDDDVDVAHTCVPAKRALCGPAAGVCGRVRKQRRLRAVVHGEARRYAALRRRRTHTQSAPRLARSAAFTSSCTSRWASSRARRRQRRAAWDSSRRSTRLRWPERR